MEKTISDKKGFSLVELVVVIAIMMVLAAASAPLLVRYIEKAQKAMDVQTASVIFRAAELAYTSGKDEAYQGYSVCYDAYIGSDGGFANYRGSFCATPDGMRAMNMQWSTAAKASEHLERKGYYNLRPVAWVRGVRYDGTYGQWENTLFKSNLDTNGVMYNGKRAHEWQRAYTNELLWALVHEAATDGYNSGSNRNYDGETSELLKIRYTRPIMETTSGYVNNATEKKPECWIVYRRDDTGTPEVWVGYKDSDVTPIRRLYPDPSPDYK